MTLLDLYEALRIKYGPRADPETWWPVYHGRTDPPAFERVITNVLVTQTDWRAVRAAVDALDRAGLLTAQALAAADEATVTACVKPVGFQAGKAKCLKGLAAFVVARYRTEAAFCAGATRDELLALHGVGEETADRILLYTCGRLAWPVDSYCKRVLARHGVIAPPPDRPTAKEKRALAATIKAMVVREIPAELDAWRRLHALMQLEGDTLRLNV